MTEKYTIHFTDIAVALCDSKREDWDLFFDDITINGTVHIDSIDEWIYDDTRFFDYDELYKMLADKLSELYNININDLDFSHEEQWEEPTSHYAEIIDFLYECEHDRRLGI